MKHRKAKCEFCGRSSNGFLQIPYPDNPDSTRKYVIFSCCGYYSRSSAPNKSEIPQLYGADYFQYQYGSLSMAKRNLFMFLKTLSLSKYIRGKALLEIGSATGEFLHMCEKFHPKSRDGIEISKEASKTAYNRYGLKLVTTNFEDYRTNKKYDTVFMFHVIEHVTDPLSVISKCMSMLNEGGTLIMETPNADSWEYGIFNKKWLAWMPYEHTYLFSTSAFTAMANKLKLPHPVFSYSPISNVMPNQVAGYKTIMRFYPFYLLGYTLLYFLSFLMRKSGIVTAYITKPQSNTVTS